MKSALVRFSLLGLAAAGLVGAPLAAPAAEKARELAAFGQLRAPSMETAKAQAQEWLKSTGKTDEATQRRFQEIWQADDRPLLDRVVETLTLGDANAAKLMAEARDPSTPAPKDVPSLLKDTKQKLFFRANLALAYAKALSNRRIYEESLDALRTIRAEQVVDPSAYCFFRAVAEHALLKRDEANKSIGRLLDDVADSPERYKMVAVRMFFEMQSWKEKLDLGHIQRLMANAERRLDLSRGGNQTQKIEREIVHRLDELIKQLEKQGNGGGGGSGGGSCPGGSSPGNGPGKGNQPSSPQQDSYGGGDSGPGNVDLKELKNKIDAWGKLPEKERAAAMADLIRSMPVSNRQQIEEYYKRIARNQGK